MRIPMIFRFSLYGFLKNQQYYDPFIILAFREKGLSFFLIGLLIGFRELAVNVMEVPTGVIADLFGRRRSMIFSFLSYIVSFVIFAVGMTFWQLAVAMVFFATGEAFRTGTHKSMILDWLRLEGREDQKTMTYGYTRSWSKMGSALSVLIAAALVFTTGRYSNVFLFTIIPYVFGIANFLGYPKELDGRPEGAASIRNAGRHLVLAFRRAFGRPRLRRILIEAMGFDSTAKVTKDYLQPVVRQMAIGLPVLVVLAEKQRTALLAGAVYFVLYIASGLASRRAYRFAARFGGESRAARAIWIGMVGLFLPMAVSLWFDILWPAVIGFILLELLRNFQRPVLITRVDNETEATMGATMLSIESQVRALGAMVLAPLIGYGVDRLAAAPGRPALWVVAAAGLFISLIGALTPTMDPSPAEAC
ncbi:MAG: MFS transporter [Planctomycetota bacterium]